jgi:hypothetical protein
MLRTDLAVLGNLLVILKANLAYRSSHGRALSAGATTKHQPSIACCQEAEPSRCCSEQPQPSAKSHLQRVVQSIGLIVRNQEQLFTGLPRRPMAVAVRSWPAAEGVAD